ncbi:unnamed protein product, partial [Polarella glacialis]
MVNTNFALLAIYTFEATFRLFAEQEYYHHSRWNLVDVGIVLTGYLDICLTYMPGSDGWGSSINIESFIRLLRVGRIIRALRLFRRFPELYKLVVGFMSTMKAIWWGFVMILMLLSIFSLLAVELVSPFTNKVDDHNLLGDPWCDVAFSSVARSVLFFFQTLVAGDSWGACT